MHYDDTDRKILQLIQGDIPIKSRPYEELAANIGSSEAEIVSRLTRMKKDGIIRRFGAVLRHHKAGFTVNAMVAWKVDDVQGEEAGRVMAGFKAVSHCYLRDVHPEFGYSLFSMIHVKSEEQLELVINDICQSTGIKDYLIIKSLKELKKESMQYFSLLGN